MAAASQIALGLAGLSLLVGVLTRLATRGVADLHVVPATYVEIVQMFLLWAIALKMPWNKQGSGEGVTSEKKEAAPQE